MREREREEILALAAVWFPKWHLRCVWREADERLRLKEGGREGEGVEGWKEKDDTERCKISLRGERRALLLPLQH